MEISISKADTHVGDLIAAMKKAGFDPAKVKRVGTVAAYECNNWNLDKMKSVMQSAGWEPQGVNNNLFLYQEGRSGDEPQGDLRWGSCSTSSYRRREVARLEDHEGSGMSCAPPRGSAER
jgi:hypothetical protein